MIDASKCAGCRYCEMVCSFKHEGVFSPEYARVTVIKDDEQGIDYPVLCRQCKAGPCIKACPVGALAKTDVGVVKVSEDRCIGCAQCLEACPFGAIKLHPRLGIPLICDLCGGDPACVRKCPTEALTFTEVNSAAWSKGFVMARRAYDKLFREWRRPGHAETREIVKARASSRSFKTARGSLNINSLREDVLLWGG